MAGLSFGFRVSVSARGIGDSVIGAHPWDSMHMCTLRKKLSLNKCEGYFRRWLCVYAVDTGYLDIYILLYHTYMPFRWLFNVLQGYLFNLFHRVP